MIQPCAARAAARAATIRSPTSASGPAISDLLRHAEIGAPVDVERPPPAAARKAQSPSSITASVVAPPAPRLAQPPPGGDVHRAADRVERDAVARGQRLQAGDPRDHRLLEGDARRPRRCLEDAQRAVVERRVAPDQQRHGSPSRRAPRAARGRSPAIARCQASTPVAVGRRRVAHRQVELDDPGRRVRQVAPADLAPQLGEIGLRRRPCAGSAPGRRAFSARIACTVICSGLPVPMPMTTISQHRPHSAGDGVEEGAR